MTPKDETRLSKFLSLVLRHEPSAAGIQLDAEGWVDLSQLVQGAASMGVAFTRDDVLQVVRNSDKQRFTLSPDQRMIRAAQGHSVSVDLFLEAVTPPPELYHGTSRANVAAILSSGLHAGSRQYVHLSADVETARTVGARHGPPAIFRVSAEPAHAEGHRFYRAENGVWLTDPLPARYLHLMESV